MCGRGPCTSPTPCGGCERAALRATAGAFHADDVRASIASDTERSRIARVLDVLDVDRPTQH
jgi:hypothetical protein